MGHGLLSRLGDPCGDVVDLHGCLGNSHEIAEQGWCSLSISCKKERLKCWCNMLAVETFRIGPRWFVELWRRPGGNPGLAHYNLGKCQGQRTPTLVHFCNVNLCVFVGVCYNLSGILLCLHVRTTPCHVQPIMQRLIHTPLPPCHQQCVQYSMQLSEGGY
jgi:hypothetical protein